MKLDTVMTRNEELAQDAERNGYPEHAKLHRVSDARQAVQGFIDWLYDEAEYAVCQYLEKQVENYPDVGWTEVLPAGYYGVQEGREQLMARFFGIDLDKLSQEKDEMLRKLIAPKAGG